MQVIVLRQVCGEECGLRCILHAYRDHSIYLDISAETTQQEGESWIMFLNTWVTGSLSHLRTKLPESSSCPQPAQPRNLVPISLENPVLS